MVSHNNERRCHLAVDFRKKACLARSHVQIWIVQLVIEKLKWWADCCWSLRGHSAWTELAAPSA